MGRAKSAKTGRTDAWLRKYLTDRGCEAPQKEIIAAAKRELRISEMTLRRAKDRIGAKALHPDPTFFKRHVWIWWMPPADADRVDDPDNGPTAEELAAEIESLRERVRELEAAEATAQGGVVCNDPDPD